MRSPAIGTNTVYVWNTYNPGNVLGILGNDLGLEVLNLQTIHPVMYVVMWSDC